jgi:hypothetical protein
MIVGESYGGARSQLLLNDLYNYASLSNSAAPYNDAQVSADVAAYFSTVFGTATPTAAQVATKFNRQFLIEPVVVGKQQEDLLLSQAPGTGCVNNNALCFETAPNDPGNCDIYNCDQPANWSNNLEWSAVEVLVNNVSTLNTALGVDATTIQWLYANQRTAAYEHNSAGYCVPSPALTSTFGALGPNDCYLLTLNDAVTADYGGSDNWDTDLRGVQVGLAFTNNMLAGVRTFVTVAAFDRVVWTPSIPPAIEQLIGASELPLVSDALYEPTASYTPVLSSRGLSLFDYKSGVTSTVAMPAYQSGHSVSMRTPDALLADVKAWH